MGKALYRVHRSKTLDDVVGQEHITKTLANALKSGRLSHAYLFTGPRGVGKTSVARILAHEVNGLKYDNEDTVHLDIIEIDAASNRRIDEIRDLREKVHIAPTSARCKVYIIDEVHMLTREAFNALLKTLEEPPAHCIFILATTEAHKVPDTIISRTQRFNFKPIEQAAAVKHLASIAAHEKIDITKEALELLAEHSQGSFRDSIGLLDQFGGSGASVDADMVRENLGLPPQESIDTLLSLIDAGDAPAIIGLLDELRSLAISPAYLAKLLAKQLRSEITRSTAKPAYINLLRNLLDVSSNSQSQERLELALLSVASRQPTGALTSPAPNKELELAAKSQPLVPEATVTPEEKKLPDPKTTTPELKESLVEAGKGFDLSRWPSVVDTVKKEAASLYTALRLAVPSLDGDTLTLAFQFPLHQKKIASGKSKELIGRIIEETSGTKLAIESVVDKSLQPMVSQIPAEQSPVDDSSIQAINNIFGGGEVLES